MFIYYSITIALNLIVAVVFYQSINITALSIIPLFLIALMLFQAMLFKNEKAENGFKTNYGETLTNAEQNGMNLSISKFLPATIPWMIPFILFFPSFVKALSIFIYSIGLGGGAVLFKIKNKGKYLTELL